MGQILDAYEMGLRESISGKGLTELVEMSYRWHTKWDAKPFTRSNPYHEVATMMGSGTYSHTGIKAAYLYSKLFKVLEKSDACLSLDNNTVMIYRLKNGDKQFASRDERARYLRYLREQESVVSHGGSLDELVDLYEKMK